MKKVTKKIVKRIKPENNVKSVKSANKNVKREKSENKSVVTEKSVNKNVKTEKSEKKIVEKVEVVRKLHATRIERRILEVNRIAHFAYKGPAKFKVNELAVNQAISIVRKLNEKFSESKKKVSLFDDDAESLLYLQATLHKIPPKSLKKCIKVQLQHSLVSDTTEVCLITGDLDKKDTKAELEPTILYYKDILKKHGIEKITEVVPLRQLRTEYKTFETKRQLAGAYDRFLSDKKISGVLPTVLGKAFYDKRKFPIQVDLNSSNLKEQVEKALSSTVFPVTCRGSSCSAEVARLGMSDSEIYTNVCACVEVLEEKLPGNAANILGLYLKTAKSQAIPIFMSYTNPNTVKVRQEKGLKDDDEAEELSTMSNTKVKVYSDGRIDVIKTRGSEDEASDDDDTSKKEKMKSLKKQTRKKMSKKTKSKIPRGMKEKPSITFLEISNYKNILKKLTRPPPINKKKLPHGKRVGPIVKRRRITKGRKEAVASDEKITVKKEPRVKREANERNGGTTRKRKLSQSTKTKQSTKNAVTSDEKITVKKELTIKRETNQTANKRNGETTRKRKLSQNVKNRPTKKPMTS